MWTFCSKTTKTVTTDYCHSKMSAADTTNFAWKMTIKNYQKSCRLIFCWLIFHCSFYIFWTLSFSRCRRWKSISKQHVSLINVKTLYVCELNSFMWYSLHYTSFVHCFQTKASAQWIHLKVSWILQGLTVYLKQIIISVYHKCPVESEQPSFMMC